MPKFLQLLLVTTVKNTTAAHVWMADYAGSAVKIKELQAEGAARGRNRSREQGLKGSLLPLKAASEKWRASQNCPHPSLAVGLVKGGCDSLKTNS